MDAFEASELTASLASKIAAAMAYAAASTLIMFVNKIVLTGYGFPSFLAVACFQYAASIVVLIVQRRMGLIPPFPLLSSDAAVSVFPVPFIFLLNTVSGLGATKMLNMPLFVLLRRFSIVMTMCLEALWIGKRFGGRVKSAVGLMVCGAFIAAAYDMSYEASGVALVLVNNLATAFQGVGLRKKMDELATTRVGTSGLMYYNNLISLPFIVMMLVLSPRDIAALQEFPHWGRPDFLVALLGSALMGFALNYCYFWCTKANSPTTTTCIGAFKNIATSYVGMLFADYTYGHLSFIGINVSVAGSLWYNWEELRKMRGLEAERVAKARDAAMESGSVPASTPKTPGASISATSVLVLIDEKTKRGHSSTSSESGFGSSGGATVDVPYGASPSCSSTIVIPVGDVTVRTEEPRGGNNGGA